ncbi:MAG: hypothetical protein JWL87_392 [Candidatus Adlerbacteria bacterium]|nr:hypothetical protein [Candidatus Adlerbacteria bacterium]
MSLFGKKSPDKTVLILDIENGSVGSALAKLSPGQAPRLFGESRTQVPVFDTRSALQLARAVEHAASESLLQASETAARLRNHASTAGPVSQVVVFLAAPWGVPNLSVGRPDFSQVLTDVLAPRIAALFGDVPVAQHAHMSAAVHGLRALYPDHPQSLLLSINGEVSELLLLEDDRAVAHTTAPVGLHTVLRTLKSHAGLSEHEARSALKLGSSSEALEAAAAHFAGEFKEAARDILPEQGSPAVFVLAHEPAAEWFARSLAHRSLADLFPQGGIVRTLRGAHAAPYISGASDIHLALNALYASAAHA